MLPTACIVLALAVLIVGALIRRQQRQRTSVLVQAVRDIQTRYEADVAQAVARYEADERAAEAAHPEVYTPELLARLRGTVERDQQDRQP